jgi:hypothetical protein
MALSLDIKLCLDSGCDVLTFYETTGIYNVDTNEGGYGAPNPDANPATQDATIKITDPDGEEYTITLETFPTNNEDSGYELPLSSIGNRTSIEDGYWQFLYTVTIAGTPYTATKSYFFYCESECCVAKLLAKIEPDECGCDEKNNKRIDNYTKARTYLASLKNAASCFNENNFNTIKELLAKLCRNADCKTCN